MGRDVELGPVRREASDKASQTRAVGVGATVRRQRDDFALARFESGSSYSTRGAENARERAELSLWVRDEGGDAVGETAHRSCRGEDPTQQPEVRVEHYVKKPYPKAGSPVRPLR